MAGKKLTAALEVGIKPEAAAAHSRGKLIIAQTLKDSLSV